jgi:hypothetical protein
MERHHPCRPVAARRSWFQCDFVEWRQSRPRGSGRPNHGNLASARNHQVEVSVTCAHRETAFRNIHWLLTVIAPHIHRLGLVSYNMPPNDWDPAAMYLWLKNPSSPITSIHFPKLLEYDLFEYPFPPIHSMSDVPRLVRLKLLNADPHASALSNLLCSELILHMLHNHNPLAHTFIALGEVLTFLELRVSGVPLTIFDDLTPSALSFPVLRSLRLSSLQMSSTLSQMIVVTSAPRLSVLEAEAVAPTPISAKQKVPSLKETNLSKFPILERLSLLGCFCTCYGLWLADTKSCPNLKHLWIGSESPWKLDRCDPDLHQQALGLTGRTCHARNIHFGLYTHWMDREAGAMVDSLFGAMSTIQFPDLESLRIALSLPAELVLPISAKYSRISGNSPSLKWIVFGSNTSDMVVSSPPTLAAVYIGAPLRPPYKSRPLAACTTVLKCREYDTWHTVTLNHWDFSGTATLVFDYHYELTLQNQQPILKYLELLHQLMHEHPQVQPPKYTLKDIIKSRFFRAKGIVQAPPTTSSWYKLAKLAVLTRVAVSCPMKFPDNKVLEALKKLVSYSRSTLKEIECTLHLEKQDADWFRANGVRWTVVPSSQEGAYTHYFPSAPLSMHDCYDRQLRKL